MKKKTIQLAEQQQESKSIGLINQTVFNSKMQL